MLLRLSSFWYIRDSIRLTPNNFLLDWGVLCPYMYLVLFSWMHWIELGGVVGD